MQTTISNTASNITLPRVASRPRQNWVLDPFQDTLFIIAAPLLVLAVALWLFARFGAAEATSLIIVAHIVMTVAHHLPTFIRIYGDTDLFKRFRWSFVLGPVVPLLFSIGVLVYINAKNYPVENFLYLYILLALWDPWHFLRQHYGFMRIYDRPNAAPRELAARMDLWLCATWFVHIMLASGVWLPELLRDMYVNAHIVTLLSASVGGIEMVATLTGWAACAMTVAYGTYLVWCRNAGFFVSNAKLALLVITFGVIYLTYTPNALIEQLAPGWTFKVGFAAVGIVHMTQYLAIVWRYNRTLARTPARSRPGMFRWWHGSTSSAVAWLLGGGYVVVCLLYGDIVTTKHEGRWLMSALLAIGFTSTLLHYYFDGFIWKVRHKQNREALVMNRDDRESKAIDPKTSELGTSWWTAAARMTAGRMFVRQLLYFGVPMTLLTVGAVASWHSPPANYVEHMYRAHAFSQQGSSTAAAAEARLAYAAMNQQLPFAAKMVELQPTSAREAEFAFLVYNQSLYEHVVIPQLAGIPIDSVHAEAHKIRVREAIRLLLDAVVRGDSLAHANRERMTSADARAVLEAWQQQLR